MFRSNRIRREYLTISEVCAQYRLKDSTLREWIAAELFGPDGVPVETVRGRPSQVLKAKQIEQLERFLRYRRWFDQFTELTKVPFRVELIWRIENGETESVIDIFLQVQEALSQVMGELITEIQSLQSGLSIDQNVQTDE